MRKLTAPALLLLLITSCRREDLIPATPDDQAPVLQEKAVRTAAPQGDPLTQDELDRVVIGMLERRNDFRWEWVDMRVLWSATLYNDHSVAIGYQPAGAGDISGIIHRIDIQAGEWKAVHDALIDRILQGLNRERVRPVALADILVEDDRVLPIITLRLTDPAVLTDLRNLENVRYVEPLDYWPAEDPDRSTSGCSASTTAVNPADQIAITPAAIMPWNFNKVGIPGAWNEAQGEGITLGVIDAGLSSVQPLLGSDFNNGDSNVGRAVTTAFTYGSTAFTTCTHGTSMSGLAVGPRNALGATTGVAYRSSLHFIRASEDVMLNLSGERTGVKNALIQMGDHAEVRIVSLSLGTPFYSGTLYDGVAYAHNLGKMIFAAAGTSFSWTSWWGVVYPAAFSECVAITGVKANGSTCASCHDGSEVDFTIPMERNGNSSRNSLSLPYSGVAPTYIGGSSCATATAAGIAALVWSAKSTATREQVLSCLRSTAQFYPTPNGSHGYGKLNASAAVNCAQAL